MELKDMIIKIDMLLKDLLNDLKDETNHAETIFMYNSMKENIDNKLAHIKLKEGKMSNLVTCYEVTGNYHNLFNYIINANQ